MSDRTKARKPHKTKQAPDPRLLKLTRLVEHAAVDILRAVYDLETHVVASPRQP